MENKSETPKKQAMPQEAAKVITAPKAESLSPQATSSSAASEKTEVSAATAQPASEVQVPVEEKKAASAATTSVKKKEEAVARGISLPISKKHSMYICSFIKNKHVESAIEDLEQVLKFKKAVPYKGEIPHRHGMMSGRYPINASKAFISVLKGLRGNIAVNGLDVSKTRIHLASASWASRSQKKGGARFKRTHIVIKAREVGVKN